MDCGRRNAASESACGFCGATLRSNHASSTNSPDDNRRTSNLPRLPQFADSTIPSPFSFAGALDRPAQGQIPAQVHNEDRRVANAELSGRVIAAEPVIHEQPDFDWCKLTTRLLWFLLLVVSPFILLRTVLVHLGALPVVLAIIGFLFLLRFFSPTNILSLLHLHMLLNPLRRNEAEQVPVRYFRVRDSHEREWIVRMKGQIDGGNIAPDDLISAWGKWRSGALALSRAYNHRTQSYVFVKTSQSRMMLAATVGLILFLGIYFYQPFHTMWQMMHNFGNSQ
jgi:hypothetical protein